jgi:S-adenosylmethionine hydrolase
MVIALLTDFGTSDYFVAAMKGKILTLCPDARIVDITHDIEPQNVRSAAFLLNACFRDFPHGTIFVVVVDPGVGSGRRPVLVQTEKYFFVAPDNGVLSFVLDHSTFEDFRIIELANKKYLAESVSQTFHGRDIFAPVAAYLAKGVNPTTFGPAIAELVRIEIPKLHRISDYELAGEVIHIDHYGNLITNLTRDELSDEFWLDVNGRKISRHCKHYAEAGEGEVFSIFGSAGFLEISVNFGSAKDILVAEVGQKVLVRH